MEYDSNGGWKRSGPVRFTKDDKSLMGLRTATFHLADARLANGGPEGLDLAIRALTGVDAAFVNVRIIRNDGPQGVQGSGDARGEGIADRELPRLQLGKYVVGHLPGEERGAAGSEVDVRGFDVICEIGFH